MTKIKQEDAIHPDGWSRWIFPFMDDYRLVCCDCGLAHDMQFRVTDDYERVEYRVRRNNRSTAQIRRHAAKVLHDEKRSKRAKVARGEDITTGVGR